NTAIAGIPDASGQAGSIGLGFAIPADTASMIAEQLSSSGDVAHAFLGVTSSDGSRTVGEVSHRGAEVISVEPGSPAQQSGLEEGDVITAVDDVTVGGAAALTGVVRGLPLGSEHTLTVVRGDEQETIGVTLVTGGWPGRPRWPGPPVSVLLAPQGLQHRTHLDQHLGMFGDGVRGGDQAAAGLQLDLVVGDQV